MFDGLLFGLLAKGGQGGVFTLQGDHASQVPWVCLHQVLENLTIWSSSRPRQLCTLHRMPEGSWECSQPVNTCSRSHLTMSPGVPCGDCSMSMGSRAPARPESSLVCIKSELLLYWTSAGPPSSSLLLLFFMDRISF